jgi:hypothetical protein
MDTKTPEKTSPEYATWKDDLIKRIRERSTKPTSQLRKEYAEQTIAGYHPDQSYPIQYFLSYYFANPQLGVSTLDDYYKYHTKTDQEKDDHMITSADLLDLHVSSLDDFLKTGIPGHHSRRTGALLKKVSNGLLWALDIEGRKERDENPRGGYGFLYWKAKLNDATLTRDNKQKMIVINQILGSIHANDTGGDPLAGNYLVRDLLFERRNKVEELLNLLSDL